MHEHGQPGTGTDEHSLKAVLFHQFVDGNGAADNGVGLHLHAHGLQTVHFLLDDGLGQTELGDTVHQHAAGQMQRFKHGHVITQLCQVTGAGQAGRAGTDNGDLVAVGLGLGRGLSGMSIVPVGHKALQTADTHAVSLLAADAVHLALAFLGQTRPQTAGREEV